MKIHITTLLETPLGDAEWVLEYSEKTLKLFPEFLEVHYEKGSEAEFDADTVIRLKQAYRKKEYLSKVEILEFKKGEFLVQRISDANSTTIMRTTLSSSGSKTLMTSEGEMRLSFIFLRLLAPIVARRIKGIYAERMQRLVKSFEPQSTANSVNIQISVAGLPFQVMYGLLVAIAATVGALIAVWIR